MRTECWDSFSVTNASNSGGNSYAYDIENRLTNFNNGAVIIAYNGDGARVWKTVGNTTTFYVTDDQNPSGYLQVLEEWTASGSTTNLSRIYNYGLGLVSQREASGTAYYFGYDGHGSTRFLTDANANVTNVFAYDAYGTLIASNSAPQTAYLYSGEQWDQDLGSQVLRARYYRPDSGRFWTMDTHEGREGEPISLHRYNYAGADPVMNTDPSGHESVSSLSVSQSVLGGFFAQAGFRTTPTGAMATGNTCGPDVTAAVFATAKDVDNT